jgi:hypothetical protein
VKKKILLFALPLILVASEMPPMPPGFFDGDKKIEKKENKEEKQRSVKNSPYPEECDVLPPMLFAFPPPMQVDVDKCLAALYKPSKEILTTKLSKLEGANVEIVSITEVESFRQFYEVKYKLVKAVANSQFKVLNQIEDVNLKTIYSNPKATKFFTSKMIEIEN